jgi:type II secretory pathway pseudopilin PulG
MNQRGVTLIEILVVAGILIILAGLALPVLRQAQQQAYVSDDMARLRQIGMARSIYDQERQGQIYRVDPLVQAGYLSASFTKSLSDSTSKGIANQEISKLGSGSTLYQSLVTDYPLTYLGLGDVLPASAARLNVEEQPAGGWLINLVRTENPLESPSYLFWQGRYQRLLFDGAVVNRTIRLLQSSGPDNLTVSSPVLFFCEPEEAWLKKLKSAD